MPWLTKASKCDRVYPTYSSEDYDVWPLRIPTPPPLYTHTRALLPLPCGVTHRIPGHSLFLCVVFHRAVLPSRRGWYSEKIVACIAVSLAASRVFFLANARGEFLPTYHGASNESIIVPRQLQENTEANQVPKTRFMCSRTRVRIVRTRWERSENLFLVSRNLGTWGCPGTWIQGSGSKH